MIASAHLVVLLSGHLNPHNLYFSLKRRDEFLHGSSFSLEYLGSILLDWAYCKWVARTSSDGRRRILGVC